MKRKPPPSSDAAWIGSAVESKPPGHGKDMRNEKSPANDGIIAGLMYYVVAGDGNRTADTGIFNPSCHPSDRYGFLLIPLE
jgi:hypothetical protein